MMYLHDIIGSIVELLSVGFPYENSNEKLQTTASKTVDCRVPLNVDSSDNRAWNHDHQTRIWSDNKGIHSQNWKLNLRLWKTCERQHSPSTPRAPQGAKIDLAELPHKSAGFRTDSSYNTRHTSTILSHNSQQQSQIHPFVKLVPLGNQQTRECRHLTLQLQVFIDPVTTRIWIRGTWGPFRSFELPKGHPQLRIHPTEITKSLMLEWRHIKGSTCPIVGSQPFTDQLNNTPHHFQMHLMVITAPSTIYRPSLLTFSQPYGLTTTILKSINRSEFKYSTTIPNVFIDLPRTRIWLRGIRGFFRSFVFPKNYPQLRILPRSLAKSTKIRSYCKWVPNIQSTDQVEGTMRSPKLLKATASNDDATEKSTQLTSSYVLRFPFRRDSACRKEITTWTERGHSPIPGVESGTKKK
jgi:hypothetical protein